MVFNSSKQFIFYISKNSVASDTKSSFICHHLEPSSNLAFQDVFALPTQIISDEVSSPMLMVWPNLLLICCPRMWWSVNPMTLLRWWELLPSKTSGKQQGELAVLCPHHHQLLQHLEVISHRFYDPNYIIQTSKSLLYNTRETIN